MAFDKEYPKRKDHRRQYYGSKAFDRSCRSHGSCPWCAKGRQHKQGYNEIIDLSDNR